MSFPEIISLCVLMLLMQAAYSYCSFYAITAGIPGTDDPTDPMNMVILLTILLISAILQLPFMNGWNLILKGNLLGNVFTSQDDSVMTIPLPFTFRFYGVDYISVTMSTNGWISFIPTDQSDFYNCYIPAVGPYAMVAGYWDDLKGMKTGVDESGNPIFADMRIIYWYDSANNRYIIEWNKAYNQYTIDLGPFALWKNSRLFSIPNKNRMAIL